MVKVKTIFGDLFAQVPTDAYHTIDRLVNELNLNTEQKQTNSLYVNDAIYEAENAYIVQIELPGVKKDSIAINLDNNKLTVTATKTKKELGKVSSSCITYGEFSKKYNVLTTVNIDNIKATFEDGVLTITIPKHEATKAKKINIL